jgi:hypothetical protein
MMRWAGVALAAVLLGLAAIAYFEHGPISGVDSEMLPYLVWLLMALLLVGVGAARVTRRRLPGSGGPGLWLSLLAWCGLIALIVALYNGAAFWAAIGTLLR